MKKGQAAMEFLMTYGWAILVVIAAIAALAYFGVLDPARLLPERCQSSAGMDCVDKANLNSSTLEVALRNNIGYKIHVTTALATGGYTTCTAWAYNGTDYSNLSVAQVDIANNGVLRIKLDGCASAPTQGDKYQGTLTVNYRHNETGLEHQVPVDIRGKVA